MVFNFRDPATVSSTRYITGTFSGGVNKPWLTDNTGLAYSYEDEAQATEMMLVASRMLNVNLRVEPAENGPVPNCGGEAMKCATCKAQNQIVNQCGCDPQNMPTAAGCGQGVNITQQVARPQLTEDQKIAGVILQQLGRGTRRLGIMIGARFFMAIENGVAFQFKRSRNFNAVRITIEANNTYLMHLIKIRGTKFSKEKKIDGIYAEDLQPIFESETGLALSL